MNQEGVAIPPMSDPAKANPKDLLEQIARLNQRLIQERQEATRRLSDSQAKCKAEMDKLRQTTYQHGKDLEYQNSALLTSLGRLKEERDKFEKNVLELQFQIQTRGETSRAQAVPVDSPTVPVVSQAPVLGGEELPMPPRG